MTTACSQPDILNAHDRQVVLGMGGLLPALSPRVVLDQLDAVQQEMDGLRGEMELLHQRDRSLDRYMQRLDEELRLAARLQQEFLPKSLPSLGRLHFHTLFRPAGYVSGDMYDVMRLDERHIGFYMADAVGHGMPAALLAMFLKHALQSKDITPQGYRLLDPGEALTRLNQALVHQGLSHSSFATAVYGIIEIDTLCLRYAKAGHPNPLLLRGPDSSQWLEADGSLLGIFPDEVYLTRQIDLCLGDRLFIYTDGIEVAFAESGEIAAPHWRDELIRRSNQPAEQLLADLSQALDGECGSADPHDDLAILMMDVS